MSNPYPPTVVCEVINPGPEPIPTTVSERYDETTQTYTYMFSLTKDERDAMEMFGLNPIVEVDGHVIRRAEGIMKHFAHVYATECFNEQKPLDCYCHKKLFRRMYEKRMAATSSS